MYAENKGNSNSTPSRPRVPSDVEEMVDRKKSIKESRGIDQNKSVKSGADMNRFVVRKKRKSLVDSGRQKEGETPLASKKKQEAKGSSKQGARRSVVLVAFNRICQGSPSPSIPEQPPAPRIIIDPTQHQGRDQLRILEQQEAESKELREHLPTALQKLPSQWIRNYEKKKVFQRWTGET